MNKREILKRSLFEDISRRVFSRGQVHICEGQAYIEHICHGGIEMNEVLFTRGDIQSLSEKDKAYFWDEKNCVLNCSWFHTKHGHTRKYREHVEARLAELYGEKSVREFVARAPFKKIGV